MNLQRVPIFLAVAKNMSYTQAAKKLYISQPAVSNHINMLEKELGARLFNRMGNHIQLTKAGEITYNYALKLECLSKDLQYDLDQMHQSLSGSLRVGASSTISQYVIPSVIAAFGDRYPDVTVSLISGNTHQINEQLQTDQIDIGIIEGTPKVNNFTYIPFTSDEIGLVSCKENIDVPESISVAQLPRIPLILREVGSGTREMFVKAMQQRGVRLANMSIKTSLGSTESIKSYLKCTASVGVFSLAAIGGHEQSTYAISRIGDKAITRKYHFIQKKGPSFKQARHFICFAQDDIS